MADRIIKKAILCAIFVAAILTLRSGLSSHSSNVPPTQQPDALFRSAFSAAIHVQQTITPNLESRNSLILIKSRIDGIFRQFFLFLHPLDVDKYAMVELLHENVNHPVLTSKIVKEFSRGGLCGPGNEHLVYDVGANIGYMSLLFASLGARTIAVEPTEFHGALFQASAAMNPDVSPRLKLVRTILTDHSSLNGEISCMELPDSRNAGFTRVSIKGGYCPPELRAPQTTLEQLFATHGSAPCAIKIDAEGYELKVLLGGKNALQKSPPNFFIIEYNTYTSTMPWDVLAHEVVDFFFTWMNARYHMEDTATGNVFETKADALQYLRQAKPPYADADDAKWNTDLIFRKQKSHD